VRHSQAEEILGLESDHALDGASWLARIHPEDRSRVTDDVLADPRRPSHTMTFRYLRPDGAGEVWLEQVAVTQFDAAERPTRVHGLMSDITERKRFEEEISRARRSAERADRAKSSFLAAASHDLRQPLQTLRFLQGALEQHCPNGDGRKMVADMGHSLDTMSSMLSSLLDVNQLESGNLSPSKGDFCLNDIFDSIAADFVRLVEDKGLRWRLVRSAVTIHSDKRMLEEILRNLLSNAIRYTDGGKSLLGCRPSGDKVRIEVWDSGIGIAQDQIPRIFEEYFQGAEGARRGGFGLGLAIVKRLGDMLDHPVDVRSTPGKGTRFSVEVPRVQTNVNASELPRSSNQQAEFLPRNVLIIEDEASVRSAVTRFLKIKGIGAVVVGTGNDALAVIKRREFHPDLVLSDYNLRGSADGFQSIRAIRTALGWNIPAIIMTGDIRSETIKMIATDDISVLLKPFVGDELLQRMTKLHRPEA